jgi:undecaprenyl-diphosphatase
MHALVQIDQSILLWINGFAHHSYVFDKSVELLADEDFLGGGLFFIFLWWMWFRRSDDPSRDRIDAIRMFAAIWFTIVIARALQIVLPHRPRPINDMTVPFVLPFTSPGSEIEHWSSFPSDHAVVLFALATAIWARYRWVGAIAYVWVFVFGCLPRIYTGFHYPGDVVVGAAIGIAVMRVADRLPMPQALIWVADRIFFWERNHAASFYCAAVALTFQSMVLFNDVRLIGRGVAKALAAYALPGAG